MMFHRILVLLSTLSLSRVSASSPPMTTSLAIRIMYRYVEHPAPIIDRSRHHAQTTRCANCPQEAPQLQRKISAPCLISSTHILRESWYISFGSAHNIGHIASEFVSDINAATPLHVAGGFEPDDKHATDVEPPSTSQGVSEERADGASEDDQKSVYSQESADRNLHGYLLSIPIIPKIKLERKATIKEPEKVSGNPQLGANRDSFLSPTSFRSQLERSSSDRNLLRRRGMADMKNFADALAGVKERRSSSAGVLTLGQTASLPSGHHRGRPNDSSLTQNTQSAPTYRPSVSLPALDVRTMSVDEVESTLFQANWSTRLTVPRDGGSSTQGSFGQALEAWSSTSFSSLI
ncbi:hypothetical protein F5I97DRAFT_964616 [Phlebopus sp. FC_14]|nr:hypothetical protein F5I97DRAFT_964616 [Phlebopus sp. FC_14]